MTDDMTFCMDECDNKECFRHPSNIIHKEYPHSFAHLKGTEDGCTDEKAKEKNVILPTTPPHQIMEELMKYFCHFCGLHGSDCECCVFMQTVKYYVSKE